EQRALIKEITGLPKRHPRVTQLFAAVFTFSWALTTVVALLAAVVSWLVFRGPLHHPELVAPTFVSLAGYVVVTNTCWNLDAVFSAFVAGRELFWVRLHETLSFIVIAAAIGLAWRSIWGLVIALIAASFTALCHRIVALRPFVRGRLSRAEYRVGMRALPGLVRFGLKITPGSIAQGASQQAGIWTMGAVAPVALVGAYSRAQTIPQRLQQVNVRIVEVLYPTLVGRQARGDGEGFDRALIDSIRYGMTGMLLVAAAFGGAAHSVLELFGPGFSRASDALVLLLLFPALASITATQTQALWAVERAGLTSVIQVLRLAVTIGLTIVLTPRMGVTGPAVGLLAGFMVVVVWNTIALRPFLSNALHVTWPIRERLALLGAYAAGFGTAGLLVHTFPSTGGLLLALAGGTVAYGAMFLVCGGINARDRERIGDILALARTRRKRLREDGDWRGAASSTLDGGVEDGALSTDSATP
ncbi:MAG TPA: lipopolysaccharide biosynthesis protein, partial [Solirubrobacteraceae bacterium]|nr:lipopolysaccharide biosynthesis protein [Solirubrobacteraceae bacterium]